MWPFRRRPVLNMPQVLALLDRVDRNAREEERTAIRTELQALKDDPHATALYVLDAQIRALRAGSR